LYVFAISARAATASGRFHAISRCLSASARFCCNSRFSSSAFSRATRLGSQSSQVKNKYDFVLAQPRFSSIAAMYL
jgi:hypothetical protein